MLTLVQNASTLKVAQAEGAPSAPPGRPSSPAPQAGGFASLLRQSQATDQALPLPATSNETKAPEGNEPPDEAEQAAHSKPATRGKPRTIDAKTKGGDADDAATTASGSADALTKKPAASDQQTDRRTDNTVNADAGLLQPAALVHRQHRASHDNEAGSDEAAAMVARGTGKAAGREAPSAELEINGKEARERMRGDPSEEAGSFKAALAEKKEAIAVAVADQPPVSSAEHPTQLTHAAGLLPGNGLKTDTLPPVAVPISAPVASPDFAQEMGLRITRLIDDGVQRAELHLNPAEMGPVSISIVLDGTQARIDFGADVAATRKAIEAGIPALASSLQDAGFTLSGGGVSQHGSQRQPSPQQGASGPASSDVLGPAKDDDQQRLISAAQRTIQRGRLDLFA